MSNTPLPDSTLFTASNPPPRPITRPPLVHFTTRDVQPPSIVYITSDDILVVQLSNSVAGAVISLKYRVLRADGTITVGVESFKPTSDRGVNNFFLPLPEGFLLGCRFAVITGSVKRGQCWVAAVIGTGGPSTFNATQQFLADYVANDMPISFPGGRQISSVEGPGNPTALPPQAPGVNVALSILVPTKARWRVQGVSWFYTTDAAAGLRYPGVDIEDPLGNQVWLASVFAGIPPASTATLVAGPSGAWGAGPNQQQILPLPDNLILQAGARIHLFLNGGGGGDSLIFTGGIVEEWIEP